MRSNLSPKRKWGSVTCDGAPPLHENHVPPASIHRPQALADPYHTKPGSPVLQETACRADKEIGEEHPNVESAARQPAYRMKVLAAEDNPVFQSMLRALLTKWGYDVVAAHDGLEAWRILESAGAPRLAILDWMMPGMDGVELCRRVRSAAREPYIYILLLTARTESNDLVEGMEAGADDYLTKPFNAQELRVRLATGNRRSGR